MAERELPILLAGKLGKSKCAETDNANRCGFVQFDWICTYTNHLNTFPIYKVSPYLFQNDANIKPQMHVNQDSNLFPLNAATPPLDSNILPRIRVQLYQSKFLTRKTHAQHLLLARPPTQCADMASILHISGPAGAFHQERKEPSA